HIVERRERALPRGRSSRRALVRQTYSLVFGAFASLWLALLLPLRPLSLPLQRRLWSPLQWPLAVRQPALLVLRDKLLLGGRCVGRSEASALKQAEDQGADLRFGSKQRSPLRTLAHQIPR